MNSYTRHRDVEIRAALGSGLTAKNWRSEAALRLLLNNLDPEAVECGWEQASRVAGLITRLVVL